MTATSRWYDADPLQFIVLVARRSAGVTPLTAGDSSWPASSTRAARWLAWAAILAQLVFTAGWMLGGWLQDAAYSTARHDISDLGALTAHAPWAWLIPQGLAGLSTMAFAIWSLAPALSTPDQTGAPLGAWLVALSLMGLDNVSDVFFRLDCRIADAGCTPAVAAASWSGTIHMVVGVATALATVAAPFSLARRMRRLPGWRDLAPGAIVFGAAFVVLTITYVVYGLTSGAGQGYAQRGMCAVVSIGVMVLARRVLARVR